MKEQFVTYEISLKLKELGFDESCLAYYLGNGGFVALSQNKTYFIGEKNSNFTTEFDLNNCAAPLWQQVIDWLREKHGLLIHIDGKFKVRISNNTKESIGHVFTKDLQKSRHALKMNGSVCPHLNYLPAGDSKHLLYPKNEYSFILEFPSYEEAQEYAILKAIELIS